MGFQIHALNPQAFNTFYGLSDDELAKKNAKRLRVDAKPGYICRLTLEDAEIGEDVIVFSHAYQPHPTPYQGAFAIFVREHAQQCQPAPNTLPKDFLFRHFSIRAFNVHHYLVAADIATGTKLDACLNTFFENENIAYLHLHHAAHGCYVAKVTRP